MSADEALFVDIENALQTSDFRVVGDEILVAVEEAFLTTKISVEEMANEFLAKLQTHPEFDLFFREEADNFAKLKSDCISSWKEKLSAKESEVADHLIGYFDNKLTRHSHRVMNIKNAMSRKVMRLRESVIQYRVGHDIKGEEKIREYNRLVVEAVKEEKDAEIAEMQARIGTLEERLRVAQISRLSDPSYRELITDRHAALDRAAVNVDDSLEAKIAQRPCDNCLELKERVEDLERIVAQHDASSQESSSVMFSPNRIVRPSQIIMNRNNFGPSDDDDDSTAADSVSVLSSVAEASTEQGRTSSPPKTGKKSKSGQKSGKKRMHRASLVKVQSGKDSSISDGETTGFRGRQRTELTPTRQGQRPSLLRPEAGKRRPANDLTASELKEEDDEDADDRDGEMESCGGTTSPPSGLSAPCSVVIADSPAETTGEPAALILDPILAPVSSTVSAPTPVLISVPIPADQSPPPVVEDSIAINDEKAVQAIPQPIEQPVEQTTGAPAVVESHAGGRNGEVVTTTVAMVPKEEVKPTQPLLDKVSETPPSSVAQEPTPKPVRMARNSIHHQNQPSKLPPKTGAAVQVKRDTPPQKEVPDKIDNARSDNEDSAVLVAEAISTDDCPLASARGTQRTPGGDISATVSVETAEKYTKNPSEEAGPDVQTASRAHNKEKPSVTHMEKALHDKGKHHAHGKHTGHHPLPRRHNNNADSKHHHEGKDYGPAGHRSDDESPRSHSTGHHHHHDETKHKRHKEVKHHEVGCQTEAVEPVKQIMSDVATQTDLMKLNDIECQTDVALNCIDAVADSAIRHRNTAHREEIPRRFSPRNAPSPLAYDSPDPFTSPRQMSSEDDLSVPSKIEISISQKNSNDVEDGRSNVVLRLEEKVKTLSNSLATASSKQEALENDYKALNDKLSFAEEVNLNQGVLFSLKLKERSLLLKELSNQVNILRNEAAKRENILQAQQARVSPGLTIPLEQAGHMPRGRGDHNNNGTRNTIQPMLERPPSAPGLNEVPKGAWNIKFDDAGDSKRPKTANAPMKCSPFTYNTPASSLLREAAPISTLIKYRKVGSFTKGMNRSNSASGLNRKNPETALREACHLTQQKPDMFTSSGGKFGRARGGATTTPSTRQHSHAESRELHEIFIEKSDDILVSSHDEIGEIRKRIGELLHENGLLNQKRLEIENAASQAKPSSPGRQRSRSPLRGRPTSPPRIDQFMQFDRLMSAP